MKEYEINKYDIVYEQDYGNDDMRTNERLKDRLYYQQ